MKISFPLHNGTFQFDGTIEEFEKLFNTPLTFDDVGEAIDDMDDEDVKDYAGKDYPDIRELFAAHAAKEGKNL